MPFQTPCACHRCTLLLPQSQSAPCENCNLSSNLDRQGSGESSPIISEVEQVRGQMLSDLSSEWCVLDSGPFCCWCWHAAKDTAGDICCRVPPLNLGPLLYQTRSPDSHWTRVHMPKEISTPARSVSHDSARSQRIVTKSAALGRGDMYHEKRSPLHSIFSSGNRAWRRTD